MVTRAHSPRHLRTRPTEPNRFFSAYINIIYDDTIYILLENLNFFHYFQHPSPAESSCREIRILLKLLLKMLSENGWSQRERDWTKYEEILFLLSGKIHLSMDPLSSIYSLSLGSI